MPVDIRCIISEAASSTDEAASLNDFMWCTGADALPIRC